MKSPRRHHLAKRSRWAHANTPEALRRRRATMDARREAIAATLQPVYAGPEPLSLWQTITVSGAGVNRCIQLFVPMAGRCDQHAVLVDGVPMPLATATQLGRLVAAMVQKRPSLSVLDGMRLQGYTARDEEDARAADE